MYTKPYIAPRHTNTVEVYRKGQYLGICDAEQVKALQSLEQALRSRALRTALAMIMTRVGKRPTAGYAGEPQALAWMQRYGQFTGHVWIDAARGVLWSPVAWSLVLSVSRAYNDSIYS